MAFPNTGILDNFNRANEGPPPSASWSPSDIQAAGSSQLKVVSNAMVSQVATYWRGGCWGAVIGPDSEVFITLATIPGNFNIVTLWLRMKDIGGDFTPDGYQLRITRNDTNPGFTAQFFRYDNGIDTQLGANYSDSAGVITNGIKFGMDVVGTTISGYVNKTGVWSAAFASRIDATYISPGLLGIGTNDTATVFDDFGGGTTGTPDTLLPMSVSGQLRT